MLAMQVSSAGLKEFSPLRARAAEAGQRAAAAIAGATKFTTLKKTA